MPIYLYKCKNKKCNHLFEQLQKFSDQALAICPTCKKTTLEKQITSGGFCLLGTGWTKAGMNAPKKAKK